MVKYCQECGNASYDSAPVCGNCGAKLGPKSEANSTPPSRDKKAKSTSTSIESSIFSSKSDGFSSKIGKKIGSFQVSSTNTAVENKQEREEAFLKQTSKPSFSKTATEGFKQKDKGIKNPATKYNMPKKEETVDAKAKEAPKREAPKKEIKRESPKKEVKKEAPKKEIKPNIVKKSDEGSSGGINLKKIGIIAIIILIILLIAGIGLNQMQNQTTDEVMNYTDGIINFTYSGNWSVYNNTNADSNMTDLAFKTKDKTLIGFTTIQSDEITYEKILSDVNDTAHSLNGEILEYQEVNVGGVPAQEIIISTQDQGYSRYLCILHDGVYYCFVANNAKSDNQNLTSLNTTEIQNMINSISFKDVVAGDTANLDTSYQESSYQEESYDNYNYEDTSNY